MPDHAHSTNPAVQAQLDRLWSLSPGADVLGLGRITALLARVGDPHLRLPPVFHVAGTNGKGSTCAFLRAMLEATGARVHVYSSPHLVRFNERIRLAGRLIEDDALAPLLAEVLDAGGDIGASFFEVTTAATFLAFERTPADACVIEVGLGGRLDATNVVHPVMTGIAGLGIDHEAFLLAEEAGTPTLPIARIAFEKAGIAKRGIPLVTQAYDAPAAEAVAVVARDRGAELLSRGTAWEATADSTSLIYRDQHGELRLPLPTMAGAHQADNAALAVAMLRHQHAIDVASTALATGIAAAQWPARMQRLNDGPLVRLLGAQPPGGVWLDGAHNVSAAETIAASWPQNGTTAIIVGMLANKDAGGVIERLVRMSADTRLIAVPVPDHAHHDPAALAEIALTAGATAATPAPSIEEAFRSLAPHPGERVLVAGSLYLAGEVLSLNDELPD
ncbi:bifunctional folylpolyglutamate synthase/dihydrofolate synthase [Sphingomonas radiodurans]|uniref:bifunctional folylpolyglutamate synthase/dihydrofolate synthase n=1 Tax=Sphingomonas radiodurans TaxID=2890321 RepID=UPI001E594C5F|nr:folylpolyglutamate synthase/dihydrofolate synthase family protein [Sphingomonas radiodurans]WBH16738.1 bifunctional folylpolyglutamate synthase/dihydrofolate synthase [Sphingomonas radiodurans]